MKYCLDDLSVIDQNSYKPLYAQLTDVILALIKHKKLKPGDPLPSETELIKHFGISRMTVRFAIQRLATEGVLIKKQGLGTFVAEETISNDLQEIKSIDEKLKQKGVEVENILLEAGISDHVIELWTKEFKLEKYSSLFKIRRLKKINNRPFAIEIRFTTPAIAKLFDLDSLTNTPLIELFNSRQDTFIHRVSYRTRSEALLEHYSSDLGVEAGSPGLVQFATYYNKNNLPILTGKIIFIGDKMEVRHEVNLFEKNQFNDQGLPEVSTQDSFELPYNSR